jgi:putative flippase GtrA
MSWISYIPFFYFQQSRLNSLKSIIFHAAYEWAPALGVTLIQYPFEPGYLLPLVTNYLAFISIYEVGYLINDQVAFDHKGRVRSKKLSPFSLGSAVIIRLGCFSLITLVTGNFENSFWWEWFSLLAIVFGIHNVLQNNALKGITFLQLAFFRFLSPIIFIIPQVITVQLIAPILLNYVLFRLITYLDSKSLIHFRRDTHLFRIGFYCLLIPLSLILSILTDSSLPLIFNGYYLSLTLAYKAGSFFK